MTRPRRSLRADGASTRARILEAAGQLFGQYGYAGVASKAICAAAGADLAAINYHFGSRDGLYRAVLIEGHKHFINLDTLAALTQSDLPPREKLCAFIDGMVAGLWEQSWHTRVCAREVLAPSAHFAALIDEEVLPKFRLVAGILGDITGFAPGDPALARCAVSIVAPCMMLMVVDRNAPSPPQQVLAQPAADLAEHLKRFALAGLDAVSAAAPRR